MILSLVAAAHLYVLPWKMLFMLPAESEKACGVTSLRYGPADGSWESGSNPPAADCQFRVSVNPGHLLPAWGDLPPKPAADVEVTYTVQGAAKPQTVTVKAEQLAPAAATGADFSAKAGKVKSSVRVELTNKAEHPLMVGDAVAARSKPKDDCVGPGPAAVIQPGETLVDQGPGLLSPSMQVFVAVFTGEKSCKWVEVARK
jgi:hypothetical protein